MSFAPASGLRRLTTLARRSTVSVTLLLGVLQAGQLHADPIQQTKGSFEDKFRQLDESLPTPNTWRNAAGQPGHEYWQQQVDYRISAVLDEDNRHLSASQTIDYQNNSPDTLTYLWLQLDQNIFRNDSMAELSDDFGGIGRRGPAVQAGDADTPARLSLDELRRQQFMRDVALGYEIASVEDSQGDPLQYTIVGTLMRIDLAAPLRSGQSTSIEMAFSFNIPEEDAVSARSGYEHFPKDEREGGNDLFLLAQWFPRLAAYTDYEGWTNKEFLGRGEFTLEFGDYEVEMTVPADHIVSSTGVLQNPAEVLTATQRERLQMAEEAEKPVFIVTAEEALENEKEATTETKTWRFTAENVRDFAWASSRKFIWDAQGYQQGGDVQPLVMAMSFYPKEGEPLWSTYSTEAIIHTMEVYSRFSFDYPYPIAQSVNGPVGGMEYPMITFNGPRTTLQDDGSRTYSLAEKQFLISVVIHEVGHGYFPMIVNSDERQWTWMDEGLNSFVEFLTEEEWENDWKHRRNERGMTDYMRLKDRAPVMTNSESIADLGPNAYGQPTVALNILREHILGREAFDHAFKTYAKRWMFKRPTPSDFFRTMEEASGVDLDWFWRGWFYSTDHVDISVDEVKWLQLDSRDPAIEKPKKKKEEDELPKTLTRERNYSLSKRIDRYPELKDFYDSYDKATVLPSEKKKFESLIKELKEEKIDPALLQTKHNFYLIEFSNVGGLVTPVILKVDYTDGSSEELKLPAEIWRFNTEKAAKLLFTKKELKSVTFDPRQELVDTDVENNFWPRRPVKSKFQLYKDDKPVNPMRELTKPEKDEKDGKKDEEKKN